MVKSPLMPKIDALKKTPAIARAAKDLEDFYTLADIGDDTRISKAIIDRLLERTSRRLPLAILLGLANPDLSRQEREGIVYFLIFVLHVDDVVDELDQPFENPDELHQHILTSTVVEHDEGSLSASELYSHVIESLPERKHSIVDDYLQSSVELHARAQHKGDMGSYSFRPAWRYRRESNMPVMNAGLRLAESEVTDDDLYLFVMLLQLLDDVTDVRNDYETGTVNLILGFVTSIRNRVPFGRKDK